MSRYEKGSTIISSNRVVEDWPKLLGDVVVVTPLPRQPAQVRGEKLAVEGGGRPRCQGDHPDRTSNLSRRPAGWRSLTRPQVGEVEVAAGVSRPSAS